MNRILSISLLLVGSIAFADSIYIACGKNAQSGYKKAEVHFSADVLEPSSRSEWSLHEAGKENWDAESLVTLRDKYQVTRYVVTEKKADDKRGYRQFNFSNVEKCGEGGPAYLQIYRVGTGNGREPIGKKKKCVCDID